MKAPVGLPSPVVAGLANVTRPADRLHESDRLFLRQWAILIALVVVLGGLLAFSLIIAREKMELAAQERLSHGAGSVADSVERRLTLTNVALSDLRNNLPHFRAPADGAQLGMYLTAISHAVDGIRGIAVFDKQGTVVASSRPELVGKNFRQRAYFQTMLRKPDAQTLYVSEPFKTVLDVQSLVVARALVDAHGEFAGMVAALLEPNDFRHELESLRHVPEVAAGLIHGSGKVLCYASTPVVLPGTAVSAPDTFFSRHLLSGRDQSLLAGISTLSGEEQIAIVRTIRPAALAMDAPLVVVFSQSLSSILASWYSDVFRQSALLLVLAIAASLGLHHYQKRQRKLSRLLCDREIEKAKEANRFELATVASGTGVWEFDIGSHSLVWDDTMFTLHGKARAGFSSSLKFWMDCVHPEDLPIIESVFSSAVTKTEPIEVVFRIHRGDDSIRSIHTLARYYPDASGRAGRIVGVSRDVTRQRLYEQSLVDSREHIACILNSLVQHIAVIDALGNIVMVNQRWCDFARDNGASAEYQDWIGLNYLDICGGAPAHGFGEEALAAQTGIRDVLNGSRSEFSIEYPCHSPTEKRWFIMHVSPLRDSLWGAVITHENITLRKLGEQAVYESEQRFSAFFEHAMVGMATTSLEKGWLMVNPALCNILGYPREELVRMTWSELTHPDDLAADVANFERLLNDTADDYAMEKRFVRKNGEIIHAFIAVSAVRRPDRSIDFFAATVEDISERKLAQNALTRAQELTQQFLDHLPGTACVKDENLRILMANRAFEAVFGIDPTAVIGKTNRDLFPGELGARLDADDLRVLESGQNCVVEEEFKGRYYETSKFLIAAESGKRLLGSITMEVTQRHKFLERQEALLKISEIGGALPEKEFLQTGLEMVERTTGSEIGFLHFVNDDQKTIELVTWTAGALKGCAAAYDDHYPIDKAGVWADCARNHQIVVINDYPGSQAKKGLPEGHAPLQRLISVPVIEEGKVRLILGVGNKPVDYDEYDSVTAQLIGNDVWRIVRRLRAERALQQKVAELISLNSRLDDTNNKLLQSEKLAAIGQLAAGVAHEINNPIGYVSSNLYSLKGYIEDLMALNTAYVDIEEQMDAAAAQAFARIHQIKAEIDYNFIVSDIHHLLDESTHGLERVRKIVQDLKDFSRVGDTGWQRVDLHQGLDSTLNIVWNEIKYKAEVERDYGELPEIYCIPSQINQVFMNLLTNAAQAIEGHGRIVLRSRCEGSSVWVEVEDSGTGIAPGDLERIFDPFYTTKPVGKGTGLGLSLSWGIIQRHHGKIEVRSEPGHGTTFRVTLPIDPVEAAQ